MSTERNKEQAGALKQYEYTDAVETAKAYFKGDDLAATVWVSKYALKDSMGKIYENSPEQMHRRIAREIERIEKRYPNPMSESEVYDLLKDFPYLIFINKDGERFVDELGNEDGSSYDEITSWWTKGDNIVYIMVDQAMVDDLKAQGKPIITGDTDWSKFEDQLAKGNILFSGSTIEEVAQKAGINAENLEKTIEKYNVYAENGYDEDFGRTRLMKAFTGGTYYIFETTPYIMITEGGPLMNEKAQVINAEGDPIPGLYQAGEIVGTANVFGRTTIGGTGNTGNLVWGKLAGENAAKYALGLE